MSSSQNKNLTGSEIDTEILTSLQGLAAIVEKAFPGCIVSKNYKEIENILKKLEEEGYNLNSLAVNGLPLLHYACNEGAIPLVNLLLQFKTIDKNLEIDHIVEGGTPVKATPFSLAAPKSGNQYKLTIGCLTKFGLKVDLKKTCDFQACCQAIRFGSITAENLETILTSESAELDIRYNDESLLDYAARYKRVDIIKLLIQKKASIDSENPDGETALFLACRYADAATVECLLQLNAKINHKNKKGYTPLCSTIDSLNNNELVAILDVLIKYGVKIISDKVEIYEPLRPSNGVISYPEIVDNPDPVQLAFDFVNDSDDDNNDVVCLELCQRMMSHILLENSLSESVCKKYLTFACQLSLYAEAIGFVKRIQQLNPNFDFSMMLAQALLCGDGSTNIAEYFIKNCKIDVNFICNEKSLLAICCEEDNDVIAKMLLDKGASWKGINSANQSALELACTMNSPNVVELLLETDAFNAEDPKLGDVFSDACAQGNSEIVRLLLEKDPLIYKKPRTKRAAPFYTTAMNGFLNIIDLLLKHCKDINEVDYSGYTPLAFAVVSGNEIAISYLISRGAHINPANPDVDFNKKPYVIAVRMGDEKIFASMIKALKPGDLLNLVPLACEIGNLNILKLLIEQGAPVDQVLPTGNTPLQEVCHYGHVQLAIYLFTNEFKTEYSKEDMQKVLAIAQKQNNQDMMKLLLAKGKYDTKDEYLAAIKIAYRYGFQSIVKTLIEKMLAKIPLSRHELNQPIVKKMTLLMIATQYGQSDLVQQLLEKGADLNISSSDTRMTPLHFATKFHEKDIIKLLLENGAKADLKNAQGEMPIHTWASTVSRKEKLSEDDLAIQEMLLSVKRNRYNYLLQVFLIACEKGQLQLVQQLVAKGVDVNDSLEGGNTGLHRACQFNQIAIVTYLLEQRAAVDELNEEGQTPLHIACEMQNTEIVSLLLQNGADPEKWTTQTNLTPIHIACKKQDTALLKLLIADLKEMNVNLREVLKVQDALGQTALHLACEAKNAEIVKLLLENGADAAVTTDAKLTPIHIACQKRDGALVKILMDALENSTSNNINLAEVLNMRDSSGRTPFDIAFSYGDYEICDLLEKKGAKRRINVSEPVSFQYELDSSSRIFTKGKVIKGGTTNPPSPQLSKSEKFIEANTAAIQARSDNNNVSIITWGRGQLKSDMPEVRTIENGINCKFYCPPHILTKIRESELRKTFDAFFEYPCFDELRGLKQLDGVEGGWEVKHQHRRLKKARLYCVEISSDSQKKGEQAKLYAVFDFDEKGLHKNKTIQNFIRKFKHKFNQTGVLDFNLLEEILREEDKSEKKQTTSDTTGTPDAPTTPANKPSNSS